MANRQISKDTPISMQEVLSILEENVVGYCSANVPSVSIPSDMINGQVLRFPTNVSSIYFQKTVTDTKAQTAVAVSTVQSELSTFLTQRGIKNSSTGGKIGAIATTKSVLNLFNNVAAFISSRMVLVQGVNGGRALEYETGNTVPGVSLTAKGIESTFTEQISDHVTADQLKTSISEFVSALTRTQNSRTVASSTPGFISSCSSSSCSCSSSCSSSSSSYIVYMVI